MSRLGVDAESSTTRALKLAIDKTSAAGFDLIEIPLMDPDKADPAAVRQMLDGAGLATTASLGLSEHTDISSEDPEIVAAGEALLRRCLEFLSDVGGTHLVGVIYSAMRKYMTPATDLNRQHSIEAIGRLSTRAAELGVQLGVEVVNRYETNVLNTSRQAVRYVEDADVENLVGPPRHLPHEHRGAGHVHASARRRQPARLRAHRGEPPRLPRLGHRRLRLVLPGPRHASGTTARWSSSRSPRRSCTRT